MKKICLLSLLAITQCVSLQGMDLPVEKFPALKEVEEAKQTTNLGKLTSTVIPQLKDFEKALESTNATFEDLSKLFRAHSGIFGKIAWSANTPASDDNPLNLKQLTEKIHPKVQEKLAEAQKEWAARNS